METDEPSTDEFPMSHAPLSKKEFRTLSDFRYQLRCFLHWSEQITHRAGVTNLQYLLMLHVKGQVGRDWATITELAERLQSHHHGVVALVTRCERLGFVVRQPGREDRRQVEIHLTAEGEKLVLQLARQHRDELLRLQGIFAVPHTTQLGSETAEP